MFSVPAIFRNTSALFKFLGYFLLLIGLGYQSHRLYKKLKVDPEIFSKENSIQSSQIPFPAVTICPPFSVKNEAWSSEFLRQNNLTINELRGASLQICPDYDINTTYQDSNANVVEVLLKAAPSFADNVYHCGVNTYWMNHQDCDKIFIRSLTEFGICFTFNMLGHDLVFNDRISSDFDTFKRTKISKSWNPKDYENEARHEDDTAPQTWSIEGGYESDDDYIQPARALKMQTLTFGTTNKINDSFCVLRNGNYKMMLHLPNELPQISYETIDIPIGKEQTILISAKMTYTEESLRSFTPEKRGCYFEGEKTLNVFKSYTKANCEYECMTSFVNLTCGCVKFSMPRTKDMKVCDNDQSDCVVIVTSVFPRSYYEDQDNKVKYPDYPCGCLPSCTEIKYKVIKNEIIGKESLYITKTHTHAVVSVIFADSQIEKTSNYVTYAMENFIFDIGGLVGLFLGSSMLSVVMLLVRICKAVKTKYQKFAKQVKPQGDIESIYSMSLEGVQQQERFETILNISFEEIISIDTTDLPGTSTSNDI